MSPYCRRKEYLMVFKSRLVHEQKSTIKSLSTMHLKLAKKIILTVLQAKTNHRVS